MENSFITLAVGDKYNLPLAPGSGPMSEGASAQFFREAGNTLQVMMPHLTDSEVSSIKGNPPECGIGRWTSNPICF